MLSRRFLFQEKLQGKLQYIIQMDPTKGTTDLGCGCFVKL